MKTHQSKSCDSRALLIDLDNCPKQIQILPQTLVGFSRVIACYGGTEPKVHLRLVPLLAAAINEGKLEIVGMEKKGKNAADFGLAFWAGRLMAEMPSETEFFILSQDSDLDHVVNMLRSAKRKVERIDGKAKKVEGVPASVQDQQHPDVVEEYCLQHLQAGRPRPARKTTLSNSIKSFSKKRKGIKPQEILRGLVERGIIATDQKGRVTYPEAVPTSQFSSVSSNGDGEIPF